MKRHRTTFLVSKLLPATILSLALIAGCGTTKSTGDSNPSVTAAWRQQPLTIDGSDKDWVKPLPWFDKTEQISYAVSNDGEHLFIQMSTKSPQEMQKIVQGGMVVWINTRAEKSIPDSKGIGYPLDRRNDHDRNLMAQARPDRYKEKPITLEDRRDYELYSFNQNKDSSIETFVYGADSPEGVVMRMDYNDVGELIYEASIPLTSIYPSNTSHSYAGKSLAVGFDIQGLPPGTETPRGEGGGPAIGVGGGVGFGSYGSGGGIGLSIGTGSFGGGKGKNKQLFKEIQVWQVVDLGRR